MSFQGERHGLTVRVEEEQRTRWTRAEHRGTDDHSPKPQALRGARGSAAEMTFPFSPLSPYLPDEDRPPFSPTGIKSFLLLKVEAQSGTSAVSLERSSCVCFHVSPLDRQLFCEIFHWCI